MPTSKYNNPPASRFHLVPRPDYLETSPPPLDAHFWLALKNSTLLSDYYNQVKELIAWKHHGPDVAFWFRAECAWDYAYSLVEGIRFGAKAKTKYFESAICLIAHLELIDSHWDQLKGTWPKRGPFSFLHVVAPSAMQVLLKYSDFIATICLECDAILEQPDNHEFKFSAGSQTAASWARQAIRSIRENLPQRAEWPDWQMLRDSSMLVERCRIEVIESGGQSTTTLPAQDDNIHPTARAVLTYIRTNPGSSGKRIAKELCVSEAHLRSRVLPKLRRYGVTNERRGAGYFLRST